MNTPNAKRASTRATLVALLALLDTPDTDLAATHAAVVAGLRELMKVQEPNEQSRALAHSLLTNLIEAPEVQNAIAEHIANGAVIPSEDQYLGVVGYLAQPDYAGGYSEPK